MKLRINAKSRRHSSTQHYRWRDRLRQSAASRYTTAQRVLGLKDCFTSAKPVRRLRNRVQGEGFSTLAPNVDDDTTRTYAIYEKECLRISVS